MAPPIDQDLLDEAVALCRQAGELTLRYFRSRDLAVEEKVDGTPVTAADKGAERLLREELGRRHPDDGIFGEEEAETLGSSGRRWIIDPIDGTKAFTHGVPLYTNLLALEDDEGIAIGVVNMPALGETIYAARNLGCWCNGAPATVSGTASLAGCYLSSSGLTPWDDDSLLRAKHADIQVRTWGDGYGYALVATGRIDAMFDPVAALYDLAPMPIIMREAGGRFSDLAGKDDPGSGGGLASNGLLHDELLALLVE